MLRLIHGSSFDFIKWWKVALGLTAAFVVAGMIPLAISGLRYSIEFTGGTLVQVQFQAAPDVAALRSALETAGVTGAEITSLGSELEYTIRAQDEASVESQEAGAEGVVTRIKAALEQVAPNAHTVGKSEGVGPRVGEELSRNAMLALLISFAVTLAYLAWRFEWRFGLAAVLATAHDIIATMAFIKLMDLEISLTIIAAILTVVGYSLNDTIIIFDRVRENLIKHRKMSLYDVLNRSVNETLPRSVLTHATTLAATFGLLILGGDAIRPFAWVMAFGVFTGTFSSMYIAPIVLLWIEKKYPRESPISAGAKPVAATR
jgi:preprotein translocase subunit SecF